MGYIPLSGSPDLHYIEVGTEGYQEAAVLNFLTGNLYVKIESPFDEVEVQDAILELAKKFSANLKASGQIPAILSCFPAEGKLAHSEQYIFHRFYRPVVSGQCIYD